MEKRKKKSLICCFDSSSVYKTQRIFQAVASKSQVKNALTQPALPQYDDSNVLESSGRRQGGHLPRPWGSEFINSFSSPYSYETHGSRLEELKQSAKKLFDSTKEPRDQLDLINTIQRLGLAHHFEDEIKHVLSQLVHPDIADDLPTVALQFRLLRQNGFFVTTGAAGTSRFVGQTEALLQEAKWIHGGCSPTTDEYLQISWITIGGPITLNYAILGVVGQYSMNKFLSEFIDHYLVSDLVCVPGLMGRLLNDLSTRKDEMKRGETLNFINCYMVQEGVSEEEARDHLEGLIRNLWKKLNKLIIEYSVDAPSIPKVVVNVTRSAHHIYRGGKYDWFGVRPKADLVSMLNSIFEPIPM
ncbi:hypothetical protein COLO4_27753 [Corchorus olitorius]|uniref:Uncharacterized protein n=1 Tax=Corchorus olitorius TaxID=93759 RepID=A0A1R3HPH2_9ROSI|nr:hypothetical protein COLO4_27753 [Corchorus olitorius]